MKKIILAMLLATSLCSAQTVIGDRIVIDGSQNIEVGGASLKNGVLEVGALTLRNVSRIEIGDDGVRVFQDGQQTIYIPSRAYRQSDTTLKDRIDELQDSLGY
jgi:hypothetical protein